MRLAVYTLVGAYVAVSPVVYVAMCVAGRDADPVLSFAFLFCLPGTGAAALLLGFIGVVLADAADRRFYAPHDDR